MLSELHKNHRISDLSEKNLHVKQNLKCHILTLFSDKDLPYIGNINFEKNVQNHNAIEHSKTHKKHQNDDLIPSVK